MQINLTAKNTVIDGHEFNVKSDYKTVTAMLKNALGLSK